MIIYGSGFTKKTILLANGKTIADHLISSRKLKVKLWDVLDKRRYPDESPREGIVMIRLRDKGILSNTVEFRTHLDGVAGG